MNRVPSNHTGGPVDPGETTTSVGIVNTLSGEQKIGLQLDGRMLLMTPPGARRVAADMDTPFARAMGLADIRDALLRFADMLEAAQATKQ